MSAGAYTQSSWQPDLIYSLWAYNEDLEVQVMSPHNIEAFAFSNASAHMNIYGYTKRHTSTHRHIKETLASHTRHECAQIHSHAYTLTNTRTHPHTRNQTLTLFLHTHTHTHTHKHTTQKRTHTHTHTSTHTHTHANTCQHTHTPIYTKKMRTHVQ